jgi:hypothetical protein
MSAAAYPLLVSLLELVTEALFNGMGGVLSDSDRARERC